MEILSEIFQNLRQVRPSISQKLSNSITGLAMLVASQVAGCVPQFQVVQLELGVEHKEADPWEGIQLPPHKIMVQSLREALQGDFYFKGYPRVASLFDIMAQDHVQRRKEYLSLKEPEKPQFVLTGTNNFQDIFSPSEFEDTVQRFLSFLPKDWVNPTSVRKFEFSKIDHTFNENAGYEFLSQPQYPAASYDRDEKKVLLNKDAMMENMNTFAAAFIQGIIHELLHGADSRGLGRLEDSQFIELTYLIYQAVSDPDRPKFEENEDSQYNSDSRSQQSQVLQFKMNEYFAEMMQVAMMGWAANSQGEWENNLKKDFEDRGALPQSAERNVKIVKGYFKLIDPSYKPWESSQALLKIITELSHKAGLPLYKKAVQNMKDKDLRTFLQKVLGQTKEDLSQEDFLRKDMHASCTFKDKEKQYAEDILAKKLPEITDQKEKELCVAWLAELPKIERIQLEYWKFPFKKNHPLLYKTNKDLANIEQFLIEIPPSRRMEVKKKLIEISQKVIFAPLQQN